MRLLLIVVMISAAAPSFAQPFRIRLSPPEHPGDKYAVSAKALNVERESTPERVVANTEYRVEFAGRAEILEVDMKGEAIRIAFTVDRFVKTEGGASIQLLQPGDIVLTNGRREDLALKTGQLSDAAREAFLLIYSPHKPGDPTDDDIFGTAEPKRIGESWPVNSRLASKSLGEEGISLPPERITGMVQLTGEDRINQQSCLTIRAEMSADSFAVKDLPPGSRIDRATLQHKFQGCFPKGDGNQSFRSSGGLSVEVHFTSDDGLKRMMLQNEIEDTWIHLSPPVAPVTGLAAAKGNRNSDPRVGYWRYQSGGYSGNIDANPSRALYIQVIQGQLAVSECDEYSDCLKVTPALNFLAVPTGVQGSKSLAVLPDGRLEYKAVARTAQGEASALIYYTRSAP